MSMCLTIRCQVSDLCGRTCGTNFNMIYTYLFTVHVGTLPLGSLPQNLESLGVPSFEVSAGSGATPLAVTVAVAIHQGSPVTGKSIPKGNPSQPRVPGVGSYSLTARPPRKLVARIQSSEFVKASEMLPEIWWLDTQEGTPASCRQS